MDEGLETNKANINGTTADPVFLNKLEDLRKVLPTIEKLLLSKKK